MVLVLFFLCVSLVFHVQYTLYTINSCVHHRFNDIRIYKKTKQTIQTNKGKMIQNQMNTVLQLYNQEAI